MYNQNQSVSNPKGQRCSSRGWSRTLSQRNRPNERVESSWFWFEVPFLLFFSLLQLVYLSLPFNSMHQDRVKLDSTMCSNPLPCLPQSIHVIFFVQVIKIKFVPQYETEGVGSLVDWLCNIQEKPSKLLIAVKLWALYCPILGLIWNSYLNVTPLRSD